MIIIKKIVPPLFVLALLACFSAVAESSEGQLNGQIFIRTEDGNAVRLSLADIYVLDRQTASSVLNQMQQLREQAMATLVKQREKAEQELKNFKEQTLPHLAQQQRLWDEYDRDTKLLDQKIDLNEKNIANIPANPNASNIDGILSGLKATLATTNDLEPLIDKLNKVKKQIHLSKDKIKESLVMGENLEHALDSLRGVEQRAHNLSPYASKLNEIKAISKTMADADGKFSLLAPDDAVVFAFSSRNVNGDTESYCWLVTTSPTDQPFMLTNKNAIDTSAPENFAANIATVR